MRSAWILVSLIVATGCSVRMAPPRASHPGLGRPIGEHALRPLDASEARRVSDAPAVRADRERVATAAANAVGKRSVTVGERTFRADCSGTARGIYAAAGLPIDDTALAATGENDTARLHRLVRAHGSLRHADPRAGDLVFFDDTYDRNGDGRRNDPLSHVGVVERVLEDGTVVFVHRVGAGILRYRMNLAHPRARRAEGRVLNHYLRRGAGAERPRTTAELFAGFGTLLTEPEARLARR
jgi:hypothetical protein